LNSAKILKFQIKKRFYQIPELIVTKEFLNKNVDITIVVPVHNQEFIITQNLNSIIKCITLQTEIIVINDASKDGTLAKLKLFIDKLDNSNKNLVKISLMNFTLPIFETLSDSHGFRLASGKYIIEVQADMNIKEVGFDQKFVNTLKQNPDVFMVSGRGIIPFKEALNVYITTEYVTTLHTFLNKYKSKLKRSLTTVIRRRDVNRQRQRSIHFNLEEFKNSGKAGRLGDLMFDSYDELSEKIYIGEAVMRGPICFEKKLYDELGGLNHDSFFQGFDEFDLQLRARIKSGYRSALILIDFDSPSLHRSTTKKKTLLDYFELWLATSRVKPLKNKSFTLNNLDALLKLEKNYEIRYLDNSHL
jgi:glycosyltransferase involved in cell wall biosynthesis